MKPRKHPVAPPSAVSHPPRAIQEPSRSHPGLCTPPVHYHYLASTTKHRRRRSEHLPSSTSPAQASARLSLSCLCPIIFCLPARPPSPRHIATTHLAASSSHPVIRNATPVRIITPSAFARHELRAPRPWQTARPNACPPARDEQRAVQVFLRVHHTHTPDQPHPSFPSASLDHPRQQCQLSIFPLITLPFLTTFLQKPFETLPQAHSLSLCASSPHFIPVWSRLAVRLL